MTDPLAQIAAEPDSWTLSVPDLLGLRAVQPDADKARTIAVLIQSGAPVVLRPRPEWPSLRRLRGRQVESGGWLLVARFAKPVEVAAVVTELGRQAVWHDRAARVIERTAAVGPLDERVLNPTGFQVNVDGPVVDLAPGAILGDGLVAGLRGSRGVRVDAQSPARTVAGLAMAGVPLIGAAPPALGDELCALVGRDVDLADPLAREEHSLEIRRVALDRFSAAAARRRTSADEETRVAPTPTVSVLLATRREDMLDFALRQVARQRDAAVELVLATHGFAPDPGRVRDALGDRPFVLAPQDADVLFGDVLTEASRRASGEIVMKMDDDDWYSPEAVADLLRARDYSGAQVVGMPAEVHYLAEPDLTVRRGHNVETPARFVAGGTMMLERALLREVGEFRPVRKFVDAQLLTAVEEAGGSIYRTHGLGYILRRNPSGHTWQVDLDYLLDPSRTTHTQTGFRPSRLMEVDEVDLPVGSPS